MDTDKLVIDQFLFETLEEYNLALEEKKQIQYIDERINYQSLDSVVVLYKKIVDSCMFQTPLGYSYLESIRNFLDSHDIDVSELPCIPIRTKIVSREKEKIVRENRKLKNEIEKKRSQNRVCILFSVGCLIVVIALFIVAFLGETPNMLNYKSNLTNKYSAWEQELTERENVLREKEMKLLIEETEK